MTTEQLQQVLEMCEAQTEDGWAKMPEGRLLTLHLSAQGVGLTIGRITSLKLGGPQAIARTSRDETFVFSLENVFASAFDEPNTKGRKAGFV